MFSISSCQHPNIGKNVDNIWNTEERILISQAIKNPDSLISALNIRLNTKLSDSSFERIILLNIKGISFDRLNYPDSAETCYLHAIQLAKTDEKFQNLLSKSYNNISIHYKNIFVFEQAIYYSRKSVKIRKIQNESLGLSRSLSTLGNLYRNIGQFDSALNCIYESIELKRLINDSLGLAHGWYNIANIEVDHRAYQNAITGYRRSLELYKKVGFVKGIGDSYFGLGNTLSFVNNKTNDSIIYFYVNALRMYETNDENLDVASTYDALGAFYLKLSKFQKSRESLFKSFQISKDVDDRAGIFSSSIHLVDLYLLIGKIDSAGYYEEVAFRQANLMGTVHCYRDCFWQKRRICLAQSKLDSALFYTDKYYEYSDSISNESIRETKENLEIKYQTEKVKSERLQAQKERDQEISKSKKLMNLAIIISALLVVAILIGIIMRQRLQAKTKLAEKEKELHQKELEKLLKEKQIEKMSSLMEGQEKERNRISRELHDGLGSLLATIKHHFEIVEGDMLKKDLQFEKAFGLLDRAAEEVRRISHDMASNVLAKFGLSAALRDLVEVIADKGVFKIDLRISGMESKLDNSAEMHIFRIIQELLSNIIKHAKAKNVTIQLLGNGNELNILVEDDGRGFNTEKLTDGMGLGNLKARVEQLNGQIAFDSSLGNGTTVIIDIPFAGT